MKPTGLHGQPWTDRGKHGKTDEKNSKEKAPGNKGPWQNLSFGNGPFPENDSKEGKRGKAPGGTEKTLSKSSMSVEELKANPDALISAGENGISVTDLNLTQESDGMLAEDSKLSVNKLIGNLSSSLDAEVAAMVHELGEGQLGTKVYSTGEREAVSLVAPDNVIYDAHTHPDNDRTPSQTDKDNKIPGSEASVVPADSIVGNETGEYVKYAS